MTGDTAGWTVPTERVVPEGVDVIDGLLVRELDIVSRQLGCDVTAALGDQGNGKGLRWAALARLAWLWAKRADPKAKLDPFLDLGVGALNHLIGADEPEAGGDHPARLTEAQRDVLAELRTPGKALSEDDAELRDALAYVDELTRPELTDSEELDKNPTQSAPE